MPPQDAQETTDVEDRGHVSSVMPTAAATANASLPPVEPPFTPTPASMVPPSSGEPEVAVAVLTLPQHRAEPPATSEPAPVVVSVAEPFPVAPSVRPPAATAEPVPAPVVVPALEPTPSPMAVSEPAPAPVAVSEPAPPAPSALSTGPLVAPGPVLIPLSPAPVSRDSVPPPVQRVLTLSTSNDAKPAAVTEPAAPEEQSGVRHLVLRNEPGVLREVCSPIVYQRCS